MQQKTPQVACTPALHKVCLKTQLFNCTHEVLQKVPRVIGLTC